MARRLAAMLSLLAMLVFIGTWLFRRMHPDLGALNLDDFFKTALVISLVSTLFVGPIIAKLGVTLIQEVIAERRSRDEMKRFRARQRYMRAIAGGDDPMGDESIGDGTAA